MAEEESYKEPFAELICTDLRLSSCQWEDRPSGIATQDDPRSLEIDCLIHDDWLTSAQRGVCMHMHRPTLSAEEIHWLLQPSCDSAPPTSWQRVHISCLRKEKCSKSSSRRLVPQGNSYSMESINEFLSQVSHENHLVTWRDILASLQDTPPPPASHPTHPSNAIVRQIIKQMYHIEVLCIDQATSQTHSNSENRNETVHPNLSLMLAALESRTAFYFIFPYSRFTLFDAALHSPAMFDDSAAKSLFVLFQLLKLLSHVHSLGVTLGEISLRSLFVDTRVWVQLRPHLLSMIGAPPRGKGSRQKKETDVRVTLSPTPPALETLSAPSPSGSVLTLTDDHTPSWAHSYTLPTHTLSEAVNAWRVGGLSNFDYLMLLNHHAGRVIGDPNNHPIFPWVIDFTSLEAGFRDLSRSKHFLTKGENQLDFTYLSAQEEMKRSPDQDPLVPHHIGDISSDVTYYVYLARKMPKEILCSRVRPRWVPEEYPLSLEKMYIWSPDECIPEFFVDTTIFKSIHHDLPDLQLPKWARCPAEFIRLHRNILEGDAVSAQLHHWIDLVFGYKLNGHDAIKAKNVYLSVVDKHKNPTNSGIVQLFKSSHPKRTVSSSAPFVFEEWSSYLNKSSVSNVASLCVEFTSPVTPSLSNVRGEEHKTLESILNQESAKKRARPEKDPDSSPYVGQENQEEELYGSFEHVNLPDLGAAKSGNVSSSNNDPGVRDLPEKTLTGSKVKGDRNSVVLPGNNPRFRLPVVDRIIRPRRSQLEEEPEYDWQVAEVSLPKEAHLLDRLTRLEELSHFVSRSCKDEGGLFPSAKRGLSESDRAVSTSPASRVEAALERMRGDPSHYPSFEERVGIDVTAVVCTVIELCCMRQLRAAIPINATLLHRVCTIKKVLKSGQLKLPSFLLGLVEFVLSPDTPTSTSVTHLPSITAPLVLQPFLPVVPFPPYFEPLFKFIHDLEQLVRQTSLGKMTFNLQKLQIPLSGPAHSTHNEKLIGHLIEFVSADISKLLELVSNEGFPLLLLHLFPFFTHPDTSFEAIFSFLDPLAQRMGRRNVERLFTIPLVNLFDTVSLPHQRAQLLCRTTAHMLVQRFGLGSFLNRFLGFYLEAVLEPFRVTTSKSKPVKRVNANIIRMPSQSLTVSQAFEGNRGRKTDLSFSLALSDLHHGYDLGKESSDEDSDDDSIPEVSILAKTPMLSGIGEVDSPLSPLTLVTEHSGSPGLNSPVKPSGPVSNSPKNPPHVDHTFALSRSYEGEENGLSATDKDSRSNSPAPLYDSSLTMSIASEAIESFDGFRDVRSDSFGGHSTPGDRLREEPVVSESDEEEEEGVESSEAVTECDPVTLAVNTQIASVAADCVCWLVRRLGPLLSTQHITRPLLDGLHRCFSGVLNTSECQGPVLKCFSFFAETYGEDVIRKLFIPKAEAMVAAATTRMSVKNEAGVAASLALIRIAIRQLVHTSLQNVAHDLSENYFVPLIQLLSSHTTFPSGGEARAAICRSMVDLLIVLGERLGREEASQVVIPTLELFFLCFDSVHSNETETQLWSSGGSTPVDGAPLSRKGFVTDKSERRKADDLFDLSTTPSDSSPLLKDQALPSVVVPAATPVNVHPLTSSPDNSNSKSSDQKLLVSESYQQLCTTFTSAMAHTTYIPFCRLLGQVNLNSKLRNTDLVEYIAYKHDNESTAAGVTIPRVLADLTEEDSDASSPPLSDSEDDPQHDAMLMVGPVSAVTGLSKDEPGFSRSVWFVDLTEEEEVTDVPLEKPHVVQSSSDPQLTKANALGYQEALFDAKFSNLSVQTSSLETPLSSALVKGVAAVAGVAGISTPAAVVTVKQEEKDMELKGVWSHVWERQLQRSVHNRDGFRHFRGFKLQTFSGHRNAVRALATSDTEHVFVSASRDKTCRVWKFSNHGDGDGSIGPNLTYTNHLKSVFGVELLDGPGQVVSCDGTVHVWDLESGYCLHQLQHSAHFTALGALSFAQPTVVMATSDFQLRFCDLRAKSSSHTWKLQFPNGGLIRSLACAENWIAVGNTNGRINTLDVRTGELLISWKPSDFYPNPATSWSDSLHQLAHTRRGNLVTSVGQGLLSLWRPTYGKLVHPLKCPAHPVHCMEVCGDQLITVSNNGHLVVHEAFETTSEASSVSLRIRNKNISSLATLPENRLLLLGNESGHITLMA